MKTQNASQRSTPATDQDTETELFPIRVLADKTTIATSTLRAWERRYGLLQPQRTPKGHRLYQQADVKRVAKIINLLNDGHSLPNIARLLASELPPVSGSENHDAGSSSALSQVWQDFIAASLDACRDFNIERLDAIYNEASSLYPLDLVTEKLILPSIKILGEAWTQRPQSGIAEEHFYSSWLKNRLGARFHHAYSQARGARIVCACAPGSYHEIGLMLFALSALSRGYRVLYFGADLPLDQLRHIAQRSAAKAIVLGAQLPMSEAMSAELTSLLADIKTPVFLGGPADMPVDENFLAAGGILLGSNIAVALKVFESRVPVFTAAREESHV